MTASQNLARQIRLIRRHNDWTQAHLATLMINQGHNWRASTVAKTELGLRGVTTDELSALASTLQASVTTLMYGGEPLLLL